MGENAEDFIISLQERISGPAKVATSAIAQLEAAIASQQGVLGGYEQKLEAAAKKLQMLSEGDARSAVNVKRFRRQQIAVAGFQSALDGARASMDKLAGAKGIAKQVDEIERARAAQEKWNAAVKRHAALRKSQDGASALIDKTGASTKRASINMGELGTSMERLGGPLGRAGGKAGQLGNAFSKLKSLGAAGVAAGIAVAVVAVAVALAMATIAATKWAIATADAARNQALAYASLVTNHKALAGIAEVAPRVQKATGMATDEITNLAQELAKGKMPAKNLEAALTAMSTATMGGASVEFLAKLQKGLVATGKVPAELAAQFAQFESIAGQKLLSLDSQSTTFGQNIAVLFSGINVEGFLGKLSGLIGIFDQSKASGRALKQILTGIFQPLIDGAADAIPMIRRGLLQVILFVQKARLAFRQFADSPVGKKIAAGLRILIGLLKLTGIVMSVTFGLPFAVASAGAAAAIGGVVVAGAALLAFWGMLESGAKAAWAGVKSAGQSALDWIAGISLSDIGEKMIAGLAAGILAAPGVVLDAMKSVVGGAIDLAKSLIVPGSPSRVFKELGRSTGAGYAAGITEEVPNVKQSMTDMAKPDLDSEATGAGKGGGGGGGGRHIEVSFVDCIFGEGSASEVEKQMVAIFHRLELEGAPE